MKQWLFALAGLIVSALPLAAIAQAPVADRTVLTRFHSPSIGDPAAKVEIVEFFDPACEACRAMFPAVKRILEEHRGRVRLTLRYVPFHKGADEVVKVLEAARRQGKFVATLETLLDSQPRWTSKHVASRDVALIALEGTGLDMKRLKADMRSPDFARLLKQDMDDAKALKVTRTPEFFVNGRPLPELGYEELRGLVAQEVRKAYAAPAHAHTGGHAPAKIDYSKAEATGFGKAADPKAAARTIRVEMADTMRFTPAEITVRRGESVRFVATNRGKVMHEMVLGTMKELREHAELMKKHPGMEHDEPHMLHVAPGKSGEMGWRFTRAGDFYYGCLVPGHFEAGMVGRIKVTEK